MKMTRRQYKHIGLAYQFTHAYAHQRACVNRSTLCYASGVVLRQSYSEGVPQTQNQCTSLVGAGMDSNPICHDFYRLSFGADFQSHAILQ